MSRKKRIWLGIALGLPLVCLITGLLWHEPRPRTGRQGDDAEALTRYFEDASGSYGWEQTGAIEFRFIGGHEYIWDRQRHFVQVKWRDNLVQLPLEGGRAVIREDGREVTDTDDRRALRDRAYAFFVNDSFWLNPFEHLRGPGVRRSVVQREGLSCLLVEYTQGGVTPGDAYVFMPRTPEKPMRWVMWVGVLPVGGIEASWEGWQTLTTGAKVSRWHGQDGLGLKLIEHARAAPTLERLVGAQDPFADLVRANPTAAQAPTAAP